jgi:hypothetical protein
MFGQALSGIGAPFVSCLPTKIRSGAKGHLGSGAGLPDFLAHTYNISKRGKYTKYENVCDML